VDELKALDDVHLAPTSPKRASGLPAGAATSRLLTPIERIPLSPKPPRPPRQRKAHPNIKPRRLSEREVTEIAHGMPRARPRAPAREAMSKASKVTSKVMRLSERRLDELDRLAMGYHKPPAKRIKQKPRVIKARPFVISKGFTPNVRKGRPHKGANACTNAARAPWDKAGVSRRTWYRHLAKMRMAAE